MEEKAEPSVDRGGLSPREIVSVANLGRRFGTKQAVSDISFCVEQNEVFALLGPNGSGKSTLLRMLCGFLQPSSGDIQIMGHCLLSEPRQAKAAIGYVPDQGGLYLHQSVRQFLDFVSAAKNIPINERKDRLDYVVTTLQLHEVLDSAIATLSRGYRQRVSLAQALLNRPKIILMDEPTNGLDPAQLRHWRDLMSSLKKDCTIIFTSHVLNEVSSLADRVGFLVDGKLVSIESLHETAQNLLLKIGKDSLPILQGNAHADITTVTELGEGMLEVAIVISTCSTAEVITDFVSEGGRLHEAKSAQVDLEALFFHAMESSTQQAPITSNLTRGR